MARLSAQNSPSIRTPKGEAKGFRRLFSSSKSRNFSPNATDKQVSSSPVGASPLATPSRLGQGFEPVGFTPAEREVRNDNMSVEADDSDASTVSSSPSPTALPHLNPRLSKAVKLLGLRPEEAGANANEVNIKNKIKLVTVKPSGSDDSTMEETTIENSLVDDSSVLSQPANVTALVDQVVASVWGDRFAPADGVDYDGNRSHDSTLLQPNEVDSNTTKASSNSQAAAAQSTLKKFFETTADGKDFINDLEVLLPHDKFEPEQTASDVAAIDCANKGKIDIASHVERSSDSVFAVTRLWTVFLAHLRNHAQSPDTVKIGSVRITRYGSELYRGMALFYAGILGAAAVAGPGKLFMVVWHAMVIFVLYSVGARNLQWDVEGTDLLLGPLGLVAWEIIASFAMMGGVKIHE